MTPSDGRGAKANPKAGSARSRRRRAALLLCLAVGSGGSWACSGGNEVPMVPHKSTQDAPRTAQLDVAGRTVSVELAYTDATRSKGLMGRTQLETDSGMLFLFPDEQPRRFWMRDTLINLDLAFLDAEGRVLNVEHGRPGVEFPGYRSAGPARFVLEMVDGWCEQAGLGPGDQIEISDSLRDLAQPVPGTADSANP
jgi:uncharacterized membrane protein (UPF0127 family)